MTAPDPWTPDDLDAALSEAIATVEMNPLIEVRDSWNHPARWSPGGVPAPWPWLGGGQR